MPGHFVCACVWRAHTPPPTTNILSYSFSHSVELPLGFTGVVFLPTWNTHFYTETIGTAFQSVSATAVPAHYFDFFMFCFSSASLQGSMHVCVWVCVYIFPIYTTVSTNQTHAFYFSPKVWSTTFSKSFQYLKIILLLHGLFHTHVSSLSDWPQSLWRNKMSSFRFTA